MNEQGKVPTFALSGLLSLFLSVFLFLPPKHTHTHTYIDTEPAGQHSVLDETLPTFPSDYNSKATISVFEIRYLYSILISLSSTESTGSFITFMLVCG